MVCWSLPLELLVVSCAASSKLPFHAATPLDGPSTRISVTFLL